MSLCFDDGSPRTVLVIGSSWRARATRIFDKMCAWGLQTVIVDVEGTWAIDLETSGVVHKVVILPELSVLPQDGKLATMVIEALRSASVGEIHGVCNWWHNYLLLSSLVAQELGVITNSHHAVEKCAFKHLTRECLISAGLETWLTFNINSREDLEQVAPLMRYPAVLKPTKGAGSYGVVKVFSQQDAFKEFASLRSSPCYERTMFIFEEYIDGPEFGVEIVVEAGRVVFCSVMDAAKQSHGVHFQGTGRSAPSTQPQLLQVWTASHCTAAVEALGLTSGVVDMDVRSSKHGPRILEVNARMGGGSVAGLHELVYGVDLVEVHLKAILGIPVMHLASCLPLHPTQFYEAGFVMSPHSGSVTNVRAFINDLRFVFQHHPNVISIRPLIEDGGCVIGYMENDLPSSLIEVITRAPQKKQFAEQSVQMVLSYAEQNIANLVPPPALVSSFPEVSPIAMVGNAGVAMIGVVQLGSMLGGLTTECLAMLAAQNIGLAVSNVEFDQNCLSPRAVSRPAQQD